ncbi:hypothetical protein F4779DRAFT_578542 [Xylariaceae sp. FL0662B]|nr:hypothetical protein F4779DRAFT_578542 [Xylariaceae sp. FL0662B]
MLVYLATSPGIYSTIPVITFRYVMHFHHFSFQLTFYPEPSFFQYGRWANSTNNALGAGEVLLVSAMSAKKGSSSREEWNEVEREYWQNTKTARDHEDATFRQEYTARQDQLRTLLVELYDRKTALQNELTGVAASIQFHEEEQERLAQEFDTKNTRIFAQRVEEDRNQDDWFARAREIGAPNKGDSPPKRNGNSNSNSGRRPSNRDMPTPANGGGWTSINGARRRNRREGEEEPPADPGNLLSSIYHNPVDETELPNGRTMPMRNSVNRARLSAASNGTTAETDAGVSEGLQAGRAKDRPLKPKERHSLPSFPAVVRSPIGKPSIPEINGEIAGETVGGTKVKSPSGRKSLPSARATAPPAESSVQINDGKEINRETLIIKDNGSVITEPPMYAGTPLERIDENHPYWDPEWETLESIIQPQLDKWKEKLDQLRQNPDAVRHTIFLANRQVNRGQTVIDFLNHESFHPYQFIGKEMMIKSYKTFINYDTIFRLCNIHEELKKFDLEVTPLQWLRQRMHEIATAQGEKFSLSKTTHDLYHDAKLKVLREKHGFGNIGRPSGYKLSERDPAKVAKSKAKRESAGSVSGSVRRKGRRSIGQVDSDEASVLEYSIQPGPLQPEAVRLQKRQRLETASLQAKEEEETQEDDLDFSGYTSRDSFSAGRIMHLDWRVYQIKTRTLTTSTEVTQYWTWKPEKNVFEHQVLRDVYPKVTWGFYQKPINFDLALEEVREIQWAADSQKILAVIVHADDDADDDDDGKKKKQQKQRGNVLAYFKRERTKKRFLSFAKKKGIRLVKNTAAQLEDSWANMESETLPDAESGT